MKFSFSMTQIIGYIIYYLMALHHTILTAHFQGQQIILFKHKQLMPTVKICQYPQQLLFIKVKPAQTKAELNNFQYNSLTHLIKIYKLVLKVKYADRIPYFHIMHVTRHWLQREVLVSFMFQSLYSLGETTPLPPTIQKGDGGGGLQANLNMMDKKNHCSCQDLNLHQSSYKLRSLVSVQSVQIYISQFSCLLNKSLNMDFTALLHVCTCSVVFGFGYVGGLVLNKKK